MAKKIIAQKFGGTSVATPESRRLLVGHVKRAISEGYFPVLVVSAMGRRGAPYATDTLLDLIRAEGEPVSGRDEDLIYHCGEVISSALISHILKMNGLPAVALTGGLARIYTDDNSRRAKIVRIDPTRILGHIEQGEIPVVTGGQGVSASSNDVTTLGRGASDTSGVAVGVAAGAEKVEIYSDVPGVAVADPRVVSSARFLKEISYQKMYETGIFGAKVLHPGAILIGQRGGVEIVCRSTFDNLPGTTITSTQNEPDLVAVTSMNPICLLRAKGPFVQEITPEDLFDQFTGVIINRPEQYAANIAVSADWQAKIMQWLTEHGADTSASAPDWGIVSMIGKPEFIEGSFAEAKSILLSQDIQVQLQEKGSIRSSFVVPKELTHKAVSAFYKAFEAHINHPG